MAVDIWFRQDMIRILTSLAQAAMRTEDDLFRYGYLCALRDVATAFGLTEEEPQPSAGLSHPQWDGSLAWPELPGGDAYD